MVQDDVHIIGVQVVDSEAFTLELTQVDRSVAVPGIWPKQWSTSANLGDTIGMEVAVVDKTGQNSLTINTATLSVLADSQGDTLPPTSLTLTVDSSASAGEAAVIRMEGILGVSSHVGIYLGNLIISLPQAILTCPISVNVKNLSCCIASAGNVNCDPGDGVDIADLTALIDNLFISFAPLCCEQEANCDNIGGVDIGDLTALIDHLFISLARTATCQ